MNNKQFTNPILIYCETCDTSLRGREVFTTRENEGKIFLTRGN